MKYSVFKRVMFYSIVIMFNNLIDQRKAFRKYQIYIMLNKL